MDLQKTERNNPVKILLYLSGFYLFVLVVLMILKTNTDICEWWSRNIARAHIWLFGNLTKIIGVSFFELFVLVAIPVLVFALVVAIISLIKKRNREGIQIILFLACFVLSFVVTYTATAGFAYNRAKMPLVLYEEEISKEEVFEIAEKYVNKLNDLAIKQKKDERGVIISPYTTKELYQLLEQEYELLNDLDCDDYFNEFIPRAKSSIFSSLMTETHIVGMFFAPTAEAHINTSSPSHNTATTMAHEIAHGKGVMREDEANLLAYYIALSSKDDYILFSGMYTLLNQILSAVSYYPNATPEYAKLMDLISDDVTITSAASSSFWAEHTLLKDVEEFFNDLYLKSNGVENGTESYGDSSKADVVVDDEKLDDYGAPTVEIVDFSDAQKLIFLMAERGVFE